MKNPKRQEDEKITNIINNYLDDFYSKSNELSLLSRVFDSKTQKEGIDVYLEFNGERLIVDEKAAIDYMDKDLYTFAFEIYSNNNFNGYGWFEKSKTTHYLLIYPKGTKNPFKLKEMELLLIKKQDIWDYLYSFEYNSDIKTDILKGILKPDKINKSGNGIYYTDIPGVRLVLSNKLKETPLNIVIDKSILRKISIFNEVIKY